jgi:toxin ParE1/3/4
VKFVILPAAREDNLRQYEYSLSEADDEAVAAKFLVSIEFAIAQICRSPGIGAPKVLINLKLVTLRSWPVRGFTEIRVYYLVLEKKLQVIRVLHSKRDINSILEVD